MNIVDCEDYLLVHDENMAWLQTKGVAFGNMVPGLSDDWEENRHKAVSLFGRYVTASQIIRMKPRGTSGFVDLDKSPQRNAYITDGFITTNPDNILHANPADCGEIAITGFGRSTGKQVLALVHASRRIVDEGGHKSAIDYACNSHGIEPADAIVCLSPSARVDSYAFPDIDDKQKTSSTWKNYVYFGDDGRWHVDFHQKTVDDLTSFGFKPENMLISPDDTAAHPDKYLSHILYERGEQPRGANGIMVALNFMNV